MSTSIYGKPIIDDLRGKIDYANRCAEDAAERADAARETVAEQRAAAREWAALLAHAEGRQADHDQLVEQMSRADKQRAAFNLAFMLLDAGLPDVFDWTVQGHQGELHIFLARSGDDAIADIETWAKRLSSEVTRSTHNGQIYHEVKVTYFDVPVKVLMITSAPKDAEPEPADAEPAAESGEAAGAVA